MLNLKVIVGSTREGRFSEKLLPWLTAQLAAHPEFHAEVLDLRDFDLPFFASRTLPAMVPDGNYNDEAVNAWAQKIREGDVFLIITAEYNHGPAAVLKNALDLINKEWNHKPVAFVSYGSVGGARAVEMLRLSAVELRMASTRSAVHIQTRAVIDQNGAIKEGALDVYNDSLNDTLSQLVWWGNALKEAREKST